MDRLGDLGRRLDLAIKRGATLGPFPVEMTDASNAPIDLSGAQIAGSLKRNALGDPVAAVAVSIADPSAGKFSFGMAADATGRLDCGERAEDDASQYVWGLEITWADGSVRPLFHGRAEVTA